LTSCGVSNILSFFTLIAFNNPAGNGQPHRLKTGSGYRKNSSACNNPDDKNDERLVQDID
jgi:hypothetical protein